MFNFYTFEVNQAEDNDVRLVIHGQVPFITNLKSQ